MIRTVIIKTPLRLPLGGGGTDLPAYVKEYGGLIVGAAIDKYVYVSVTQSDLYDGIFVSALHNERNEIKTNPDELENVLVKEALKLTGFDSGLIISSVSDIIYGTGLGSSGAFLVGLLHALFTLKGEKFDKEFLADRASHIFLERMGSSEGKQDPYLTALGGFNAFELDRENRVRHLPFKVSRATQEEFEERAFYFYTGISRQSSKILDDHQKRVSQGEKAATIYRHKVKEIGKKIKISLEEGDLDAFGAMLHEHWLAKKESSSAMSVSSIDGLYELARGAGMLGGKILGAGGGGFFQGFAKRGLREKAADIFRKSGLREIRLKMVDRGTEILFDSAVHN